MLGVLLKELRSTKRHQRGFLHQLSMVYSYWRGCGQNWKCMKWFLQLLLNRFLSLVYLLQTSHRTELNISCALHTFSYLVQHTCDLLIITNSLFEEVYEDAVGHIFRLHFISFRIDAPKHNQRLMSDSLMTHACMNRNTLQSNKITADARIMKAREDQ